VFKKARGATLDLIPLYAKISPTDKGLLPDNIPSDADMASLPGATGVVVEEFDFDASLVLLPETKQLDITSRFRRDSDAYYVEAKRSTVSSVAQIPIWMYGVLVVLGWNEAMVILFNPLYFTFLLVCLGAAYVVFQLGLTGPIISVGKTVLGEVSLLPLSQRPGTNA
jgi:protein SEY1